MDSTEFQQAVLTRLGDISRKLDALAAGGASRRAEPAAAARANPGEAVLPNYGRSKGAPVRGASMGDLEYYLAGCQRTLADPTKSRWHDKERLLQAALSAEIARQGGGEVPPAGPPPDFGPDAQDDIPF